MADRRKVPDRRVLRSCERHRLEEQLLAMAYEEIRPVIRRRLRKAAAREPQPRGTTQRSASQARSA